MEVLVRSMTALSPSSSSLAAEAAALSPRPHLPVSTSASDARVAALEQQLSAAEQQREAASQQLLAALQRAEAAAGDVARCAALRRQLRDAEASGGGQRAAPALLLPHLHLCCAERQMPWA